MPRTTERAEIIAALGLEPEGRSRSDRYDMTLTELRQKLKARPAAARSKTPPAHEERQLSVDDAMRIIKKDYYEDVRRIADDLRERVKDGEIKDEEKLTKRLHEDVDGSARVIYTFQNKLGLLASDNEDAYEDEYGEAPVEGNSINWAVKMAAAMTRDVEEELDDVGDLFKDEDED